MTFDFLDIGCSKGGSLAWCAAKFGGTGLGIDLSERKVQATRAAGHQAIVADAAALDMPDGSVRFVMFSDMLEHLRDGERAERCVAEAYRVCRDFVVIRGPNFDHPEELERHALKRYYADWKGHSWHHRTEDLVRLARRAGAARSLVTAHGRIHGSEDRKILPASAPPDQSFYDAERHGPKPLVTFERKIFSRIVMVLAKSPEVNIEAVALTAVSERMTIFSAGDAHPPAPEGYSGGRSRRQAGLAG